MSSEDILNVENAWKPDQTSLSADSAPQTASWWGGPRWSYTYTKGQWHSMSKGIENSVIRSIGEFYLIDFNAFIFVKRMEK